MKNIILMGLSLFIGLILTTTVAGYNAEKTTQEKISENVLRFHILANSDTEEDQTIKELVRDDMMAYMAGQIPADASLDEVKALVNEKLADITHVANESLISLGSPHRATARLTVLEFPEITYGDMTMPSGYYTALQIRIGAAVGHNWWCVMFPMLCFAEDKTAQPTEEMKAMMKDLLTEEEYNQVFNVKFKSLELIQGH